jgi:hypothetical protein
MISLPLKPYEKIVNKGFVKPIIHVIHIKRAILNKSAAASPIVLTLACFSSGNLLETIEIKIILSIPSTISKKVKVANAIHASTDKKISIIKLLKFTLKSN